MRTAHLEEVLASKALRADMVRRLKQKRQAAVKRDGVAGACATPAELEALAAASNGLCPDCGIEMVYAGWKPYCLRQVSLDRLDDELVHAAGNVRLCCYACNVAGGGDLALACLAGCHEGAGAEAEAAVEAGRREEFESAVALLWEWLDEEAGPLLERALEPFCEGRDRASTHAWLEARATLSLAHRAVRPAHKRLRAWRVRQEVPEAPVETPAFRPAPRCGAGAAASRGCGAWGGFRAFDKKPEDTESESECAAECAAECVSDDASESGASEDTERDEEGVCGGF